MHQPTTRKEPKRYMEPVRTNSAEKVNFMQRNKQIHSTKKLTEKQINQPSLPRINTKHANGTIPQKVERLEKAVDKLSQVKDQPEIQKLLLREIQGIKSELKEIKQQIGISPSQHKKSKYQKPESEEEVEDEEEDEEEEEQNIANMVPRNYNQSRAVQPEIKSQVFHEEPKMNSRNSQLLYDTYDKKQLLEIGKLQPYMKEFKLENTKLPQPIYTGYHKKSSKPIILKYCIESKSMQPQINLYQKLWKNIVKAKKICINKIYDINEPMAHNLLALEMNKHHLGEIPLSPEIILKDVLRGLQFFHECGFLYRDLHPTHVMQSFEGNIVLLGLKRIKRFIDIKNRFVEVRGDQNQEALHQFVSNARLRGIPEGRKDDLQTLGYLALYLLEGRLPWTINSLVQGRSKVTLQQLYGKHGKLFEFMATIHKMSTDEQPNYDNLCSLISI